jgi:hypothetical protein
VRRLASLALALVAGASAEMPVSSFRGERLRYDVSWGGMVVGYASIECLPTNDPGLLAVRTTARANHSIQSLYPVSDTIQSLLDPASGLPVQFRKVQREGSYTADVRIDFDREKAAARVSGTVKGKVRPDTLVTLSGGEYDLLSAFQRVRGLDLEPGKSLHLSMVDNRKRFPSVEVRCLRRELLDTGSAKVRTIVVEPKVHGDALFSSKGRLLVWLTDDSWHVPVQMESKIKLGTIHARLVSRTPPP